MAARASPQVSPPTHVPADENPRYSLRLLPAPHRHQPGRVAAPAPITCARYRGCFMTVSMYKISVPIFVQFLTALSAVLDKTAAHCEAKKIDAAALLTARLSPDMYPLARQVRAASDHAVNATARLAGAEPPALPSAEASFADLKDRLDKAIAFIKNFKAAQIDGTEDKAIKITFGSGATRDFTGQSLLLGNSLPNFYFHCTTAYDIVRHCGVEVGKRDFMGTPVSL